MTKKFLLFCLLLSGCAPTLPDYDVISKDYSLLGSKTFKSTVDCSKASVVAVAPDFITGYCPLIESQLKSSIQRQNPNLEYSTELPDIVIESKIEQINGGSAGARFWVGFGAGRSVTTIFTRVSKGGQIIAERRFSETTTMPTMGVWDNDSAILQDAPIVAKKIATFIRDPLAYNMPQQ